MDDQERAAFEKWADLSSRQAWRGNGGTYKNSEVQAKWEGWQARADRGTPLAAAAPVAEPAAWMTEDGRIVPAKTKAEVLHASTARSFCIPLYAGTAPVADQAKPRRNAPCSCERRAALCDGFSCQPAAPVAAPDRKVAGWIYGNSFWQPDNPRLTDEVKQHGKPVYE